MLCCTRVRILLLLLCLLYTLTLCYHEGRPRRHKHHMRRFFDSSHGHRRGHNHHGYLHGKTNNLVAENHIQENSINGNQMKEDPKKSNYVPGLGSQWSMTYQGIQQESSTINNTVSNVTAQLGGSAFLPCRVGHLGDRQISWIRRRDWHVITSADVLYTNDKRFAVLHAAGSQDWTLHIKYVSVKDNGTYECQVSTGTGIISLFVNLAVVTPEAHIPGHGQYHVNHGSPITLTCLIKQSPTPPQHVFWYHNGALLNYVHDRPEVAISTEVRYRGSASISLSKLEVAKASDKHSGNYTCEAPNTFPAFTMVFVTEGDKTAAVQRIDSSAKSVIVASDRAVIMSSVTVTLLYLVAIR